MAIRSAGSGWIAGDEQDGRRVAWGSGSELAMGGSLKRRGAIGMAVGVDGREGTAGEGRESLAGELLVSEGHQPAREWPAENRVPEPPYLGRQVDCNVGEQAAPSRGDAQWRRGSGPLKGGRPVETGQRPRQGDAQWRSVSGPLKGGRPVEIGQRPRSGDAQWRGPKRLRKDRVLFGGKRCSRIGGLGP